MDNGLLPVLNNLFDVRFERDLSLDARMRMFVDGVEAEHLPDCAGIRKKFVFESNGRKYFAKVGWQSADEVVAMSRIEREDARHFIPIVQCDDGEGEETFEYVIQEFMEFDEADDYILDLAWNQIKYIGAKYRFMQDLRYNEREKNFNWALIDGIPVIYDVGYV